MSKSVRALQKLETLMGPVAARELVQTTMQAARVTDLDDPNQLFRFASELIRNGGVLEAVGRAIKIQAILSGATEAETEPQGGRQPAHPRKM